MLQCPAQSLLLQLALSKFVNVLVSTDFYFLFWSVKGFALCDFIVFHLALRCTKTGIAML